MEAFGLSRKLEIGTYRDASTTLKGATKSGSGGGSGCSSIVTFFLFSRFAICKRGGSREFVSPCERGVDFISQNVFIN